MGMMQAKSWTGVRRVGLGLSVVILSAGAVSATRPAPRATLSQPADGTAPASSLVSRPVGGLALVAGDRIRVSVYEKLSLEDDKWSERRRQSRPDETYALRSEMSGESVVQADETISLPILGSIPVQGLSTQALEDEIRARFREVVGRPAKASVSLLERPPISVVGPVKQPGTYKFTPGMTVLHAVALAGGLDQKPSENWAGLEVARDAARATTASQKLSKSLASLAVLRAERDGKTSAMPEQLVDLVGREAANGIYGEAKKRRERLTTALRERRVSLASAVATAERALTIAQERTEILSQGLSSRQKRADALREPQQQRHGIAHHAGSGGRRASPT
ncbi:polysaccharide biosynthesis/export family protein [Methylobacterium sp. P31]